MLTLAIPNYNGARYLDQTLQSLRENRSHCRWWFQDAGSVDGSISLAETLAGPEDRVVVEKDGGQADALNRAMRRMGGEWIGFINSDDLLLPGAAQAVCGAFESNPWADLVVGKIRYIEGDGTFVREHQGDLHSLEDVLDIYQKWWKECQWVQPEVFYRRRLWERVGGFDIGYTYAFDYDFWVRCFQAGARVLALNRPLAAFRLHPQQKSSNSGAAAEEIRRIAEKALREAEHLSPELRVRVLNGISYERYQLQPVEQRAGFGHSLLSHPGWFWVPEVRERIGHSLQSKLGFVA